MNCLTGLIISGFAPVFRCPWILLITLIEYPIKLPCWVVSTFRKDSSFSSHIFQTSIRTFFYSLSVELQAIWNYESRSSTTQKRFLGLMWIFSPWKIFLVVTKKLYITHTRTIHTNAKRISLTNIRREDIENDVARRYTYTNPTQQTRKFR